MIRNVLAEALELAVEYDRFARMLLRDRLIIRVAMFLGDRAINLSGTWKYNALNARKTRRFENRGRADQVCIKRPPRELLDRWANLSGKMENCRWAVPRDNAHQPRQVTDVAALDHAIGCCARTLIWIKASSASERIR